MSATDEGAAQETTTSPQHLPLQDEPIRPTTSYEQSGWMDDFAGTLLIQCDTAEAQRASALVADRPGAGLVLTGPKALTAARALREHGFEKPLLCDAARYRGNKRYLAREPFDKQWILSQRRLNLPTLTDSGYVDKEDLVVSPVSSSGV